MEFRDCNQATMSGAGKGAAVEGAGIVLRIWISTQRETRYHR